MKKSAFKGLCSMMILSAMLLSSFEMMAMDNLPAEIPSTSDVGETEDMPFAQKTSSILETPQGEGDSITPSQEDISTAQPQDSEGNAPSISPADNIEKNQEDKDSPYWKIEPALLASLKSKDTVEVIITSTDMNEVRKVLGYENQNSISEGKRHDLRLDTSILEIQSHMIPKIASLDSVISIQSYRLHEPPQLPECIDGEAQSDTENEPTMWNAVKYHGADEAWNLGYNGSGVKVAVMDTGVDFGHPDLNGTQARDENPSSPYYGWPLAFDSRSMMSYLSSGGEGFPDRYNWYSDTSTTDTDGNANGTLDVSGYNVSGIISQSGIYHIGEHPDKRLRNLYGNYVAVLVVDENSPGNYDTVYVDLDNDNNFTDEKACRKGDEVSVHDITGDGTQDRSGGMIYFIADGTNPVPYSDIIAAENGYSLPIPTNGSLVVFMLNVYDPFTEQGGNHGTLCASAIAGQGVIAGGRVKGTAPEAKIIAVGNIYQGGNILDSYYFAVEGYDGIPGTGDEANIVSCSYGDSDVIHDGWDFESRFVDNLTTNYAPNVTFAIASGNGGYGYGTVASPGSSAGVITVGAALNKQVTEVVYWSNRGPNAIGQLDPDVVSVGVNAYGDLPLNQRSVPNGNSAYQTWSGTSLATPVTAGIVALTYDAYFQSNGEYPSSELAREILMSTADNLNYDPLVQGAGFCNAARATKVANNVSGLSLSPAFWSAGSYRGSDHDAFAHIMHPGETDNITISVTNADQNNAVDVFISDYILSRTETYSVTIEANKSREESSTTRPDFLIPLNDSKNGISHIPNGTALLKVSGYMPWDEFDPDFDYSQENRFWITIYNWKDSNGNSSYWNDTNGDGVAQPDEIEWSELTSICSSSITATTQEARMHDPMARIDDGLIVGVFHYPRAAAPEISNIYVQSQCYNRTDWDWLSSNITNISIGAGGRATFNASLAIPLSSPIGLYEGIIALNDTRNETAMPVIVNVASNSAEFTFGGNTLSTDLYANDQVFGAFRWGWRYEGGDWRFYFTDIPDSFDVNPGTKIVADVKWGNYPTDIDVFILGGVSDSYSIEMPDRFGPYTLHVNSASVDKYIGNGKFRFDTSTNGPQEIISADLSKGLNEIILHNVLYAGQSFSENVTGTIGIVNVTPYPWDLGFIDDVANLTETQQFTLLSSFNLSSISAKAFGVYPPMEYPNELIYQNDPDDKKTSNWSREFDVSGAEYIKVNISSQYSIDIDLFLLRDDGDGIPEWGSEQVAESTSPYADEEIILNNPLDGKYWVFVHGWNVPTSPSVFDCYIEAVYGNDIIVTDVPVGAITANEPAHFNASVTLPPIGGEYRGVIMIGLSDLGDTISVPFMAELESEKPTISNLQPVNGSWINSTQPMIGAQYNDSGSGIDLSRVFIYLDGVNQTGDAIISSDSINLTPVSPLPEGLRTVYLIVTDMFGNQNSTTWQFLVDSKEPTILSVQPANNSWVNSAQPLIGAQYNDSGSGINLSAVFIVLDGINWTLISTITSDSITLAPFWLLSEGLHTVYVEVTDLFGYQNSTTWQFLVDTMIPTISNLQPVNGSWVNLTQPMIGAEYDDIGSGIDVSRVFIYIDGSNQTGNALITSSMINLTPISPLSEGIHTVYLIVMDLASNENSTTWQFLVDSQKPYISNLQPANGSWINSTQPIIGAQYSDTGSGMNLSRVFIYFDGVNQTDNATINSGSITYIPASPISEGGHTVDLMVGDLYGYQNSTTWQFFVDLIKPTISNLKPVNGSWVNSSQPEISAKYTDSLSGVDVSRVFIYVDGSNQTGNATITSDSLTLTPISPMSQGNHTVYLIVTDLAGNQNSTTWQFLVDSIKPMIYNLQPPDGVLINSTQPTIGARYNDSGSGIDLATIFFYLDGVNQTGDATITPGSISFTPASPISEGNHVVYLTMIDIAGNQNSTTWQFFIDTIKPTISSVQPSNGSWVNLTQPNIGALYDDIGSGVNLSMVFLFVDGIDQTGNATITSSSITFTPSSPISEGIHTVYLTVSDKFGNQNSTTWQFYVDSIDPIAEAGTDKIADEDENIDFNGSSCSDENGLYNLTWNFGDGNFGYGINPSHSYSQSGTYIVTLTVWDIANNTAVDTLTVYVNNVAPNAEAGNDQTIDEGETVFFDGSTSNDTPSDMSTLLYTWYFDDGTVLSGVTVNHIFEDDGIYTVTLVVTDDNGYTDSDIVNVTVNNVAPTANIGGPYSGEEGSPILFSGSASDPGDDTFTYEWDFNDSDGITYTDAIGQEPSWTWPDDFSGTIYLRVTDDDGGFDTNSTTVTINNVAPMPNAGGPYFGDEGSQITLTGSASDPGDDTFTYEWDLDNDGFYDDAVGNGTIWTWDDNGVYIIGLKVTDDDGGFDTDSATVTISNVAPTADAGGPYSGDEGSDITFAGGQSDPGISDTFTYYWDFGDGSSSAQQNPTHIYTDNAVYTAILTVTDKDGGSDSDTATVMVNNVAPLANAGGSYSGSEGTFLTFKASATDPGTDTFIYEWDFDDSDGITYTDATGPEPTWTWPDDFSGTIYLRVTDDDGGVDFDTATVTINNVAPIADAGGPYSRDEGSSIMLTGSASDPGDDTFIFEWDLDNDGFYDDAVGDSPVWAWDDNGIYIIGLKATDDDGGFDIASTTIAINNVAPIADAGGPYSGNESSVINFTGTQTDPGTADTFTYLWDFGDGKLSTQQNPAHVYADDGVYTVTFTVTDDDGGIHTDSSIAIVYNNPPAIETIEGMVEAREKELFVLKINATDAEGDAITFTDNTDMFNIDPISGLIEFTPTNDDVGINEITITASDDDEGTTTLILLINIVNVNDPPVLEELGPQMAVEDQPYSLTVLASDIDTDDVLSFSDDTELFDIDTNTGAISFTPTDGQVGTHLVTITVTDAEGARDSETLTFTILNTNDAPVLSSIPDQNAKIGERFTYTVLASDIDDAVLLFSDDSDLFVIDPVTGIISFIPQKGDEGKHTITITVIDSYGDQDSQTFTLEIEGVPDDESKPEPETDWMFLILLILIITLIWPFIIYMLIRRKGERKEEPETTEQEVTSEQLPLFPEIEGAPPPPPELEDEKSQEPDFEELPPLEPKQERPPPP